MSTDNVFDISAHLRELQTAYERSPNSCTACGMKLLLRGLCPDCDDRRREQAARQERVASVRATIPKRYQWCSFAAPELASRVKDPTAIAKAKAASVPTLDRVVLAGSAGTGKTVLATCMLMQLAPHMRGMFVDAITLAGARAHERLGHEAPIVRDAMDADLLCLDDLGQDRVTALSAVTDVLFERHANERAVIVTTGYSVDALESKYGAGLARRLFEHAAVIELVPKRVP